MREMTGTGPQCEINNNFWLNFTQVVRLSECCCEFVRKGIELICARTVCLQGQPQR